MAVRTQQGNISDINANDSLFNKPYGDVSSERRIGTSELAKATGNANKTAQVMYFTAASYTSTRNFIIPLRRAHTLDFPYPGSIGNKTIPTPSLGSADISKEMVKLSCSPSSAFHKSSSHIDSTSRLDKTSQRNTPNNDSVLLDIDSSLNFNELKITPARVSPLSKIELLKQSNNSLSYINENSPETRRRLWHSKILRLKDDVEKSFISAKSADQMPVKASLVKSKSECLHVRKIKVEHTDMKRLGWYRCMCKIFKQNITRSMNDDDHELDTPQRNLTPDLIVTSLKDCMFSAEINMVNLPMGDITIQISGYSVYIIIDRKRFPELWDNQKTIKPIKYAEVNMPIYVNSKTLSFDFDESYQKLSMQGQMKGYEALQHRSSDLKKRSCTNSEDVDGKVVSQYCLDSEIDGLELETASKNASMPILPRQRTSTLMSFKSFKLFRQRSFTN